MKRIICTFLALMCAQVVALAGVSTGHYKGPATQTHIRTTCVLKPTLNVVEVTVTIGSSTHTVECAPSFDDSHQAESSGGSFQVGDNQLKIERGQLKNRKPDGNWERCKKLPEGAEGESSGEDHGGDTANDEDDGGAGSESFHENAIPGEGGKGVPFN